MILLDDSETRVASVSNNENEKEDEDKEIGYVIFGYFNKVRIKEWKKKDNISWHRYAILLSSLFGIEICLNIFSYFIWDKEVKVLWYNTYIKNIFLNSDTLRTEV